MEGSIVKVHCLDAPPKNANKLINAPLPHTAPPAAQPQQQQPVVAAPSSAPSTVAATGQVHVQRTKRTSDGSSPGAADGSDSAARDAKRLRQLDSNVGMLLGNGVSAP